jgi:succinate dehydrogenase/fumarate reductase flavoprotein subunit
MNIKEVPRSHFTKERRRSMSANGKVTRRQFLKSTAVVAGGGVVAAGAIGSFNPPSANAAAVPEKWDMEADVIVVGSGPTGLPAAIAAVEKGASVIVLEQLKEVGGCGVINGGILHIGGGTKVQKLNGIQDTPDLMFKRLSDYKDHYNKRSDHSILRVFCDYNPGTFEWLEARGVRFWDSISGGGGMDSLHQRHPYHNVRWEKEGPGRLARRGDETTSGAGVIRPLEAHARSKGVKILLEHKMTKIIRQGGTSGRVLGVEAQAGDKKLFFRGKKAVILGTGSWKGNKFLRKLFDSRITEDFEATGVPFVNPDGSGIIAGLEAGAILVGDRANDSALFRRMFGTKHYQFPLNSPYGAPGLEMAGARWGDLIFVNKAGKRFFREEDVASYGAYSFFDVFFAQEGHVLWTVFDDKAAQKNKWNMAPPATEKGCAFSAPTLNELAKLIQVPGDALAEEVQKYNTYVDAGKDPDFDKPKKLLRSKIETPPFSAAWVSLYVHDTCGGLAINAKSQILDIHGKVIPGLYGGGETVGGLEFVGMNRGIILGRIAGENAAAESPTS